MSFSNNADLYRTEEEQRDLLGRLAPFEGIATPANAPAGSRILALHDAAQALAGQCDRHVARITELRGKLQAAREKLDTAMVADDFAAAAARKVELGLLSESLQAEESAALATDDALAAAERELETGWRLVTNARTVLRRLIEHGDELPSFRYRSRGPHCWAYLRDYLDVVDLPAGVVARSDQAA